MPLQSDAIRTGQLARRTSNQFLEATSEQLRHDCQFHTPQSIATPLPVSGASPWTFCRRMKLAIAILVAATLTGCGSMPVDDMPDEMEIVGDGFPKTTTRARTHPARTPAATSRKEAVATPLKTAYPDRHEERGNPERTGATAVRQRATRTKSRNCPSFPLLGTPEENRPKSPLGTNQQQ